MLPPIQCPQGHQEDMDAEHLRRKAGRKCGVLRLTLSQLLPLHPTNLVLISGASHTGERARSHRLMEVNTLEAFLGKGPFVR